MATPTGLEPATSRVTVWYSTLLNYGAIYRLDFSQPLCIYYIRNLNKNQIIFIKIFNVAARPRIELRLDFRLGGISNPLGYHYPTAPYMRIYT